VIKIKTCAGCKALLHCDATGRFHGCFLCYDQVEGAKVEKGFIYGWTDRKPSDDCPNPKTYAELTAAPYKGIENEI